MCVCLCVCVCVYAYFRAMGNEMDDERYQRLLCYKHSNNKWIFLKQPHSSSRNCMCIHILLRVQFVCSQFDVFSFPLQTTSLHPPGSRWLHTHQVLWQIQSQDLVHTQSSQLHPQQERSSCVPSQEGIVHLHCKTFLGHVQ